MKAGEEVEIMKRMRTEKGRGLKTFGLALMFVVLLFVQVKNAKAAEIQSGTCGKNGDNLVFAFLNLLTGIMAYISSIFIT